jgi:hypothetical protein
MVWKDICEICTYYQVLAIQILGVNGIYIQYEGKCIAFETSEPPAMLYCVTFKKFAIFNVL